MSTPRFLSGLALLSGLAILVPPALAQGVPHRAPVELTQAALDRIDRERLSGFDRVSLLKARARQIS